MKNFFTVLKNSSVIIGSVIGAGFISGREIVSFFYGQDVLSVSVALLIGFFFGLCFLLIGKNVENNVVFTVSQPIMLFADLVIMGGMLSGLDSIFQQIFRLDAAYPVLSVVCVILSNVILYKGISGIGKVNLFLCPLMITVVIILTLCGGATFVAPTFTVKPLKLIGYVGLNLFTSSVLFIRTGKDQSVGTNVLTAFVASAVIAITVYLIAAYLRGAGKEVVSSDVPLLRSATNYKFLVYPFAICLISGIFTTLLSSHYPLFLIVENKRWTLFNRIFLSVVALVIARLGFYNIVSFVYPSIGLFGALAIIITAILTAVFRPARRSRTSARQVRTE